MFVSTARFSMSDSNVSNENYEKAKNNLWSKQPGFHSMNMYEIVEGQYKGQRLTVIRFQDEDSFRAAFEAVKTDLDAILADNETKGVKREEVTRLNEVA